MSLSAAQIANTTATAFDVGLRYYASGALTSLSLT